MRVHHNLQVAVHAWSGKDLMLTSPHARREFASLERLQAIRFVILCTLLLFCPARHILAQSSLYHGVDADKQYPVFEVTNKYGTLYAFLDLADCVGCYKSVATAGSYGARSGLHVVFFIKNFNNQNAVVEIAKNINAKIVEDHIGAYAKLYDVHKHRCILVQDNMGRILYAGVAGSTALFSEVDFKQSIEQLKNSGVTGPTSSIVAGAHPMRVTRQRIIRGASLSPQTSFRKVAGKEKFILLDPESMQLHQTNSSDSIVRTVSIASPDSRLRSYKPKLLGISQTGDTVVILDSDAMSAQRYTLMVYFRQDTTLTTVCEFGNDAAVNHRAYGVYDPFRHRSWIARLPKSHHPGAQRPSFSIIDSCQVIPAGEQLTVYDSLYMLNYYISSLYVSRDVGMEVPVYTDSVILYDPMGNVTRRCKLVIPHHLHTDMLSRVNRINASSSTEQIVANTDSISTVNRIVAAFDSDTVALWYSVSNALLNSSVRNYDPTVSISLQLIVLFSTKSCRTLGVYSVPQRTYLYAFENSVSYVSTYRDRRYMILEMIPS
jgi:hypothetical protein